MIRIEKRTFDCYRCGSKIYDNNSVALICDTIDIHLCCLCAKELADEIIKEVNYIEENSKSK